jgi:DNA-binding LacI/PurR family transcriptional regulator
MRSITSLNLSSEAQYIEQYLEQHGYTMYTVDSRDEAKTEAKIINLMLSNKMDGIILNSSQSSNLPRLEDLRAKGFPVVLLSGFETVPAIDSVYPDVIKGAYIATKHLLSMGHKRVIYITKKQPNETIIVEDLKLKGFKRALADEGISFSDDCVFGVNLHNSIINQGDVPRLIHLAKNETAFFLCDDDMAIHLIKILNKNGIMIPRDIAITSMDNIRFAEICTPALTTIGFDLQYISHRAVDLLIDCMEGRMEPGNYQNIKVKPEFFIRDSCGYLKT